jgi:hypothetical protein
MLSRSKHPQDYIDAGRATVKNDVVAFKRFMTLAPGMRPTGRSPKPARSSKARTAIP